VQILCQRVLRSANETALSHPSVVIIFHKLKNSVIYLSFNDSISVKTLTLVQFLDVVDIFVVTGALSCAAA